MAKTTHAYSRTVRQVAELLGTQVRQARIERRWSVRDLAQRAGISAPTLLKVERGDPTVSLGTALDVATLVGVPLFFEDHRDLAGELARQRDRLALLPANVRQRESDVDDDF